MEKDFFYGEKVYKDFRIKFPYLYEKGLKSLNARKYIIKVCTDSFSAKDFFGYELDIQTNKYKQYTDGMYVLDLIKEHPQFKDYYYQNSKADRSFKKNEINTSVDRDILFNRIESIDTKINKYKKILDDLETDCVNELITKKRVRKL